MTCHTCGSPVSGRHRKRNKLNFCDHKCYAEYKTEQRDLEPVKMFLEFHKTLPFSESYKKAGISKWKAWKAKKGFYDAKIPHSKWSKDTATGFFNVHEMEWL